MPKWGCPNAGCKQTRSNLSLLGEHKKTCKFTPAQTAFDRAGFKPVAVKRKDVDTAALSTPAPPKKPKTVQARAKRSQEDTDVHCTSAPAAKKSKADPVLAIDHTTCVAGAKGAAAGSAQDTTAPDGKDVAMAEEFLSLFNGLDLCHHTDLASAKSKQPTVATVLRIHAQDSSTIPGAIMHMRTLN
jgi:hypothetical protein